MNQLQTRYKPSIHLYADNTIITFVFLLLLLLLYIHDTSHLTNPDLSLINQSINLPSNLPQPNPPLLIPHSHQLRVRRHGHRRDASQRGIRRGPVAVDGAAREVDLIELAFGLLSRGYKYI